MTKTATVYRDEAHFLTQAKAKAKELGLSLNAFLQKAVRAALGVPEDTKATDVIKGVGASTLISDGILYNWTGKRKLNPMHNVHLVSHGRLWVVDKTANYSHKIVRAVTDLPECVITRVGVGREDVVTKLLRQTSTQMASSIATLFELEQEQWFQELSARKQDVVIDGIAERGDTLEQLRTEYGVITTPPEPVLTRLKDSQLQQRYGINVDMWHQSVEGWKKKGLETIDGLVWSFRRSQAVWVANT